MLTLARDLGVDAFNPSQFAPTGRGSGHHCSDVAPTIGILAGSAKKYSDMYLSAHSAVLEALAPDAGDCRGGCQAGMSIGCITAEGDVTPCVMFPIVLGNLKDTPLSDIWSTSPVVAQLKSRNVGGACGTLLFSERRMV